MFYALVVDLTGAPQELITPDEGTVTGWEYGSPDPVGVEPQAATSSGYVSSNPVLWLTRTNSKYAPNYLSLISGMLEGSSSISPEEPYSLYTPEDDCPSGKLKGLE